VGFSTLYVNHIFLPLQKKKFFFRRKKIVHLHLLAKTRVNIFQKILHSQHAKQLTKLSNEGNGETNFKQSVK
jgi:hypothetical protein